MDYVEGLRYMLSYYRGEYERSKNKMDDNHPFLVTVKQRMKDLRSEISKFKNQSGRDINVVTKKQKQYGYRY